MEIILLLIVIGLITWAVISSQNKKEQQKDELLESIENIKTKTTINKLTTFIEKEDGSYAIVGKDSIVDIDSGLNGTLTYHCMSNSSFVLVFKDKIGIVAIKNFMTSSDKIYYINYDAIKEIHLQTLINEKEETKESGSRLLRGGIGGAVTGSFSGAALGALSVSKTTVKSEEYAGTKVCISLKKVKGDWFAKSDGIVFYEPSDAVRLEMEIKEHME